MKGRRRISAKQAVKQEESERSKKSWKERAN